MNFIPKVISLKLFLDTVTSFSAEVTRALRGCFRGGFVSKNLQRCGNASALAIFREITLNIPIWGDSLSYLDLLLATALYSPMFETIVTHK